MATNANANGIPFLKRTGIPPAIKNSMVVYYDIKKQGCTNESMKANPVLKDFSGNGNDGQCNGFAWNHESGIGEFVFKKFSTSNNITVKENIITFNFTPDISILQNNISYTNITFDTPATKVKVTGIKDGIRGTYYYRNSEGIEETVNFIKDGIYNFPKSFNTVQNDVPNAGFSTGIRFDNPNKATAVITIEQLDYYKDAICTDGVDDFIYRNLGGKPDNATVVFDVDWSVDTKNCGIQVLGNMAIYNQDSSNRVFLKHRTIGIYYPKTIIAIDSNNNIYENNLNALTNTNPQDDTYSDSSIVIGGNTNNDFTKMYLRRIAVFNRVLTADEIKYVYEKIFGCKLKTMEERVEDSIILHYDIAKQGATNDSMKSNPRLIDLSGHGYDAVLNNFAWTENSGINTTTYPNSLMFDGVDDYGVVEEIPIFMPEVGFTVIAKRKILNTNFCTASYSPEYTKGAFIFEIDTIHVYSFGKQTSLNIDKTNRITYMTSKTYNGTAINKGADNSKAPLVIGRRNKTDSRLLKGPIYIFMLFNRDLTTEEIEFVKQKYFSD